MPSLIETIKDSRLCKLTGGAQDDVELAVARTIRDVEEKLGQPVGTVDIPKFVTAINERHGLVPAEKVEVLAANVGHAYNYATHQKPCPISRAGYTGYKAEGLIDSVSDAAKQVGAALSGRPPQAQPT
jgi:hypothetical protein